MLGLTLFDLTRLLVCVDVQREILRILPDLLQPFSRDRPDAVGGDTDLDERTRFRPLSERIDPRQEGPYGLIPKSRQAAPGVGDRQQ